LGGFCHAKLVDFFFFLACKEMKEFLADISALLQLLLLLPLVISKLYTATTTSSQQQHECLITTTTTPLPGHNNTTI
jgi:hypothetical protein